jgi:hypothetical protein
MQNVILIFRCQRKIWKLAGKGIEGFPLKSNSRHLRASRTASIHESGNRQLASMAPDIFNHREETSRMYYQTFNRGRMVASAKKTFFDLFSPDRVLTTPNNGLTTPNNGLTTTNHHEKKKPSMESDAAKHSLGQSCQEPRKSGRDKKKPKFLSENFI